MWIIGTISLRSSLRWLANCIAQAEKKASTVEETVSHLLNYGRSLFLGNWGDPLTVEAITSFLKYFGNSKLGASEFGLIWFGYALDRRNKCDYLTEEGLDIAFNAILEVAKKSGCSFEAIKGGLDDVFTTFCTQKGRFSVYQSPDQTALDWWRRIYGGSTLKSIALRFSKLNSSSGNIERTFSSLKWYQGTRRANLGILTLEHITRIRIHTDREEDTRERVSSSRSSDCPLESQHTAEGGTDKSARYAETPELLAVEIQVHYNEFRKYVDFGIVNPLSVDECSEVDATSITEEQMEQLKKQCRVKRLRIKSVDAHAA